MSIASIEVLPEVVALGVSFGLVYGLLAVGLVLAFRTSRVLNLAIAETGVFAATVLAVAVTRWHVPYWMAFVLALAVGGLVGAGTELVAVRRLQHVPAVLTVVATLGLGQALMLVAAELTGSPGGGVFPEPTGLPAFELGRLYVGPGVVGMLVASPLAIGAVMVWLRWSSTGLDVRAVAAHRSAARLLGIPASRRAALAWGVAGALAAITAVFVGGAPGFEGSTLVGPLLLLRALTAAVVARMSSLPVAFCMGVVLGVVEQVSHWNVPGNLVEVLLLAVVVVALGARYGVVPAREAVERWIAVESWRPLPAVLRDLPEVARLRQLGRAVAIGVMVLVVVMVDNAMATRLAGAVAFAVVGLSVGLVTGLGGRLSLGQFALAAVGGVTSVHVVGATGSAMLGLMAASLTAAVVGGALAVPTLRSRGPALAVVTLAFAVVVERWMFAQPWALGDAVAVPPLRLGGFVADTGRRHLAVALLVAVAVSWLVRRVWTSGVSRRMVAVRDNQDAARALGIDPRHVTVLALTMGGAVAGVGGAVHAHGLALLTPASFPVAASITVVAMAVIGGLGTLSGPVLGALFVIVLPLVVPLDAAVLAGVAIGWFLLIVYVPAGLAGPAAWMRDRLVDRAARHAGLDPDAAWNPTSSRPAPGPGEHLPAADPPRQVPVVRGPRRAVAPAAHVRWSPAMLEVRNLQRSHGAVRAVDGVDLVVPAGQVVGIVGPNGAGKTTLVDLVSGFSAPEAGQVRIDGLDITGWTAVALARRGIVRSFQHPVLFPTMTVLDAVLVAAEQSAPTGASTVLLGDAGHARLRDAHAALDVVGLRDHAHLPLRTLSTGLRRLVELACLEVLAPRLLLLDEPSAGLSGSEVPGLIDRLRSLHVRWGVTMVVVEHDRSVVMALADRVVMLDRGRVVRDGAPDEVLP